MSDNASPKIKNRSRRHHYIPTFYLRQWAMDDGRICQFSRPHDRVVWKHKHPEATGYKDDLYSIEGAPAEIRSYLEDYFLARADQLASDALQCFLKDRLDLSDDLRSGWTRFIISLLQRTPQKIAWLLDNWNREMDAKVGTNNPVARAISTMQMLQTVMDLPQTGAKINGMIWNVVSYSNTKFRLLTSDRPVIISDGLLKPDSHVIVPIGPERLFIAGNTGAFVNYLHSLDPQQLIARCNETIVLQAHTYVYAEDERSARYIENRLGKGKPQLITRDIKQS